MRHLGPAARRRERAMRLITVFLMGGLALMAASPALASTVFKAQMICNLDDATPFTDQTGSVAITDKGDVKVKIKGLQADTEYLCNVICNFPTFAVTGAEAPCTTDSKGRLDVKLKGLGRQGALAPGCGAPFVLVVESGSGDDLCISGYGSPF
jgi:hypothetical protein